MTSTLTITKKEFIEHMSDGFYDANFYLKTKFLKDEPCLVLYFLPICDTAADWINEWIDKFNARNNVYNIGGRIVSEDDQTSEHNMRDYYAIYRVPYKPLRLPKYTDDDDDDINDPQQLS